MKRIWYASILTTILIFMTHEAVTSQVIESDPLYPLVSDSVYITFHVNRCSCNLMDYSGDIYAHTGILTDSSADAADWQYVIAGWNENLEKARLLPLDDSTFVLRITPDIFTYYGLFEVTVAEQLAFVFRSADGSRQTANIYYDIYKSGLSVSISQPDNPKVIAEGELISIAAEGIALGTEAPDSLTLYIDNEIEFISYTSELSYDLTAPGPGQHWIKIVADNGTYTSSDSIYFFVREEINVADLPVGLRDGVNILNDSSVSMVLYAPGKESILLIGDFNDWTLDNDYMMNQTPDGYRFWLTVDSLTTGEEYAFQYLIDGHIRIADPYSEKILDPANDPYIPASTYPDLKAYPVGKTSGIVGVFQIHADDYQWKTESFAPVPVADMVIYELHVQNFTSEGNFAALTDTLNYLARLGINAIELMPVNEFEGNQSWGYNPSFYFALDKIYGTKNDFKAFVDSCHSRGMAVIIDMVLNHSYSQSPLVRMYWDEEANKPAADNPWYNSDHNFVDNTSAHWGYDFNHDSQATRDLIDSINSYWMSEYRIDGFRFDFTKGFSNTLWTGANNWASSYDGDRINNLTRMADAIWERNSDALVIFEHLADNTEETVLANAGILLWGNMNYEFNEATMGYTSNFYWGFYTSRSWDDPHLVTYMESHDEERLMYKNQRWGNSNATYDVKDLHTALARTEAVAAFFFAIPGPKMMFQWGELGYDYSINRCTDGTVDDNGGCRLDPKPLGWGFYEDPYRYRLYKVFEALIKLKTEQDVFETADIAQSTSSTMKRIVLTASPMSAVILGNFGLTENSITPNFPHTGTWYNYLDGESLEVTSTEDGISLLPGEYKVYLDQQLEIPDIPIIIENLSDKETQWFQVYPNPSAGIIHINTGESRSFRFELYTLTGEKLIHKRFSPMDGHISFSVGSEGGNVPAGTYIYRITGDDFRQQDILIIQ